MLRDYFDLGGTVFVEDHTPERLAKAIRQVVDNQCELRREALQARDVYVQRSRDQFLAATLWPLTISAITPVNHRQAAVLICRPRVVALDTFARPLSLRGRLLRVQGNPDECPRKRAGIPWREERDLI